MNQPVTDVASVFSRFAESVLDETGRLALRYFRTAVEIEKKADGSPVTVVDRDVEAHIRQQIAAAFPEHGVVGEEGGSTHRAGARYEWVIDPIDGTASFISGIPLWGTLLALLDAGRPILGAIDAPALNERWIGTAAGCFSKMGEACATSGCERLGAATVFATSPDMFSEQEHAIFDALSLRAKSRRFGGDCYSYAMLAAGYIDAVVEAGLEPYDFLALVPVIEGAGGVMTDWKGDRLSISSGARVLAAATPALHQELLSCTSAL